MTIHGHSIIINLFTKEILLKVVVLVYVYIYITYNW